MSKALRLLDMLEKTKGDFESRIAKDGCLEVKIDEQWEKLPRGWTMDSLRSMWKSLTGDRKHKITACAKKMAGKVSDEWAFCASLARKLEEQ